MARRDPWARFRMVAVGAMAAALLSALVLCVLLLRGRQARANVFASAAFVLMTIALVITLAVNVPIDRQIQSWTTAGLPPYWQAIRDRWEFFHGLRTLLSVAALTCLFAGMLSSTADPQVQRDEHVRNPRTSAA